MMSNLPQERNLIRDLAAQYRELAESAEYETRRVRWRDVNGLRKSDRAPVWIRPAGVWSELLPQSELVCQDPYLREIEYRLRQDLLHDGLGDDHVIEPWWDVPAVFDCTNEHLFGLPTQVLVGSTDQGGWRFKPPLQTPENFEKVVLPDWSYNPEKSAQALEQAHDVFDGVLEVRQSCHPHLHQVLGVYLDQLRGMGEMMLDLYVQPHLIHRLMAKILETCLRDLRAVEASGLLTPNNYGGMRCCDPINGNPPPGQVRLHHLWGDGNSQEFDEVSPAMWEEFLLNYQKPALQQFGRVQYGCCEDLTQKVRGVLSIPNLRVFVCSFWTNLDTVLEAVEDRYCVMWRQSAAEVTLHPDLSAYERYLDEHMPKLRGHFYQVVLREIQTLDGHPDRLREWAQLTIRKAEENA